MGLLSDLRKDRAQVRAHASALKSSAKAEARAAAKETRAQAKEAHKVELAEARERAKLARKSADRRAKRQDKAERKATARKEKLAKRDHKAENALVKADRKRVEKEAKLVQKDRKQADKIEKAGRKHEYKMAEMELKKIDSGKFGKKDVQRYLEIAKVATPVLLPLVYKFVSQAQGASTKPRGLGAVDLSEHGIDATGPGAALGARIVRLEQTLDQLEQTRGQESGVRDFAVSTRERLADLRTAVEAAESTPTRQRREVHSAISGEIDRVNRDILARLGVSS